MIFTGRLIPAPEAQAIGLINRVVAKESIESEVMAMATQIAVERAAHHPRHEGDDTTPAGRRAAQGRATRI